MLKKLLIFCAIIVLLVAGYAAAGFYGIPRWVKAHAPTLVQEKTGATLKLQDLHLDPFALKAELQGVELAAVDGSPLLAFEQLALDVDVLASVRQRAIVVDFVELQAPRINLERRTEQRFNFSDVLDTLSSAPAEPETETQPAADLPVLIHRIAVKDGEINWRDLTVGEQAKESLIPVNFSITEVSNQPDAVTPFTLNFNLASGGRLEWQGDVKLDTLASQGQIKLDKLALTKVWQLFLQDALPLEIQDGSLSLQTRYDASYQEKAGMQLLLSDAGVQVKQLVLAEKGQADKLIELGGVAATGIKLNLQKQAVDIASISGSDGRIKAWLDAEGQVNYQRLFASEADDSAAVAAEEAAGSPWQINVAELALANYQIEFTDHTQPKPVVMHLSDLNLGIKDYRNEDGIKLPVQFSTRINETGSLNLSGDMVLSPFSANWQLGLKDLKLKTFQTYLDPFLAVELVDGGFNAQGQLQMTLAEPLQLTYQGDANIDNLVTRDNTNNKDFLKWANLEVMQMQLDVPKQDYRLGTVVFDRPYFRFTIKKDRSNNVEDLLVAQKPAKSAAKVQEKSKTPANKEPEPVVSIGQILMKEGQSDFADYSMILPFVVKMNQLSGEVGGFVSNTDKAVKLKLQGRVHDLATVKIKGNYQLQSGDSDITLDFSHMPLPLVTPYMAEFAGYRIEKGQMALDLTYRIKKGQLSAQNKVFIDQLVLGEKVENPNAKSLPLEFGVALLKDADGKINLDFPITGSMEDPQFSVGSLVADVLVNLITKAVTSPFRAMASLFDADEDFSSINFAAGSSDLAADEIAKLDQIAKALSMKPALILEIKGLAFEVQDWPAMRFDALMDILKKMRSGELRDYGGTIRSEYIELSDDEYKRLLAKFYAEVFPLKIEYSFFGTPRIKNKPDADFYQLARQELEAIMKPEPQRLNELAVSRANHIAKYLTERAGVARSRIYVLATELKKEDAEAGIHAVLSLNVAS